MNEIAVVTAVTGAYDHMGRHQAYRRDVDYLFFTDGSVRPLDEQWEIVPLPGVVEMWVEGDDSDPDHPVPSTMLSSDDPWRLAKLPKIHPHLVPRLAGYRYVIWIDGDMQIIHPGFVDQILAPLRNGLVLSPHFDPRHCGYGEGELCLTIPKYRREPLAEQMAAYRAEGFPENFGLYECGVEARDMTAPLVADFGGIWLSQILRWSIQDQVSCGYALWKTGLVPDVLPRSWRQYGWLHLNAHTREDPRGS